MKINKTAVISLAVITVTLILCMALKAVPVSRIWDSYSVVYVDKDLSENKVLDIFESNSVEHVISLGRQKVPFISDFTPVLPQRESTYLSDRLSYFYDYSETYSLYYIPRGHDSGVMKAIEEIIQTTGATCGIDGKQQYPWIVPIISLVVFFIFTFLSKNRKVFVLSSAGSLVLSFSQVFYPVAAAATVYMLSCYLASRIWGRRKAMIVLKKNLYVIIPLVVSVLSIMVLSIQCAVLVLMCSASSVCALILLDIWEKYVDSKSSLKIVKIFGAPQLPLMHPGTAKHTLMCLVPLFLILVVYLLSSRISSGTSAGISIPVPVSSESVENGEKILPGIEDYYKWSWKAKSYPYKSLNEQSNDDVNEGDAVTISRYEYSGDKIVETQNTLMVFNNDFRESALHEIDSLGYDAVEKVMKKQGKNVSVVYRNGGETRGQTDVLGLILILVCTFVPVLLLLIYMIKSGRKYR